MSSNFADLGLPAPVVTALVGRGITEAFPIQSMAIPPGLTGKDVCGRAPTGSGKTLAFGLPLALRVSRARPGRPRALVLAPTRELAAQIHDELRTLLTPQKRTVASFYGGVSFIPQLKVLRRGVDVAVACPGRLADLVRRGNIVLDEVEIVVIDEADRMADMG
ncbi:MAG TPA: DEAD/DEAH box helicase, partial [Acidimicrobiales bacterium]|nr:DEAD/DEAH box helicase [Acidimicrobiales bacterium]